MSFSGDLNKFTEKVGNRGPKVAAKVGLMAMQGVVSRSPVRLGRFRGSWMASVGSADRAVAADIKSPDGWVEPKVGTPGRAIPGHQDPGNMILLADSRFRSATWGETLFVSNSLPYAKKLEDGSSKQTENRPDGILGATVDQIEANVRGVILAISRE